MDTSIQKLNKTIAEAITLSNCPDLARDQDGGVRRGEREKDSVQGHKKSFIQNRCLFNIEHLASLIKICINISATVSNSGN